MHFVIEINERTNFALPCINYNVFMPYILCKYNFFTRIGMVHMSSQFIEKS